MEDRIESDPLGRPRASLGLSKLGFLVGALALVALLVVMAWLGFRSRPLDRTAADPEASERVASAVFRLGDREASERLAAIGELERFGPYDPGHALPCLGEALKDETPEIRASAALALVLVVHNAGGGDVLDADVRRAIAGLFDLRKDPRPEVRAAGLQALWMIGSMGAGRSSAVEASRVEDALFEAAGDPEEIVRVSAVKGLGVIGPKVAEEPPMVVRSALDDRSEKVREAASEALFQFREGLIPALPALIHSFEKTRPEARPGYARLLERIRPPVFKTCAMPSLVSGLASPDEEIRSLSALAFISFARADQAIDPAAFAALAEVLRSAKPQVRVALAESLGRFRPDPAFIPVLGEAARDPDEAVRVASLRSLDEIGHTMAFVPPESVASALEDGSPKVRYWAAGAIGHAGLGIDPLVPALLGHAEHDPDPEVRIVCADELREFIKPPAITPVIVPILAKALESPDRAVRWAACAMLGSLGKASAPTTPSIVQFLRDTISPTGHALEPEARTEQHRLAATALGQIAPGTPSAGQAVEGLIEAIHAETPPMATIATIKALARFGTQAHPAIPRLRQLEKRPDEAVIKSARETLEAIK